MKPSHWAIFAGLCIGAVASHASFAGNNPVDAAAPVSPVIYRSSFTDYRALGDDRVHPWKEANDTVGTIGGWRAYAKEAAESARAAAAKPAVPITPATSPTPSAPPATPHPRQGD